MTANDKAKLDGINLTNYLLKSQLPDVSKFITTATADNKYQPKGNYQPKGDYAQKNYVDDKIKNCASKDDITSINKTLKDVDDFLKSINKNLGGN